MPRKWEGKGEVGSQRARKRTAKREIGKDERQVRALENWCVVPVPV